MKTTLLIILMTFMSNYLLAQENPWIKEKNIMENPWITEEEKKNLIEEERKKQEEINRQEAERRVLHASDSSVTITVSNVSPLTVQDKINKLRSQGINVYELGYRDSEKYYNSKNSGVGAFFMTLVPIIGNPIVWIMAASKPSSADVANNENPNRELLNDREYKDGFKKAARKARAKKVMVGNLLGNLVKLIFLIKVIN